MKTKIIFVDDDPMLLASTRRQLRRKIPDSDMLFFEKASEALESIADSPANVVLSDLRMPEMDGAEFLSRVAEVNPGSIRLAWTGQSEVSQLKRVFQIAHQVFSKPCPTQSLIELIGSAVSVSLLPTEEHEFLLLEELRRISDINFLKEGDTLGWSV